jgi:aminoglycoside phosphotransferase (APT) family kinase protein
METLHRLHQQPISAELAGLPRAASGGRALLEQAEAMLSGLGGALTEETQRLTHSRPTAPAEEAAPLALLHGDPVAANAIRTEGGMVVLVDWQCPALGDPAEDLAVALSPAMQLVYGDGPFAPGERVACLAAYPDPATRARLRVLAPCYHYRMAAYCLWKIGQGDLAYAAGFESELAALEQGQDPG